MEHQAKLFTPALEVVHLTASWKYPQGWSVGVAARRSGQSWDQGPRDLYEALTAAEALDVACASLGVLLS